MRLSSEPWSSIKIFPVCFQPHSWGPIISLYIRPPCTLTTLTWYRSWYSLWLECPCLLLPITLAFKTQHTNISSFVETFPKYWAELAHGSLPTVLLMAMYGNYHNHDAIIISVVYLRLEFCFGHPCIPRKCHKHLKGAPTNQVSWYKSWQRLEHYASHQSRISLQKQILRESSY